MTQLNKTEYTEVKGVIADGEYISKDMDERLINTDLAYINFYSDEYITIVTPTAGTVLTTLSPNDVHYKTIDSGDFNAVDAYLETRTQPNAQGLVSRGKITLTGITGATHFKAVFWRY